MKTELFLFIYLKWFLKKNLENENNWHYYWVIVGYIKRIEYEEISILELSQESGQ